MPVIIGFVSVHALTTLQANRSVCLSRSYTVSACPTMHKARFLQHQSLFCATQTIQILSKAAVHGLTLFCSMLEISQESEGYTFRSSSEAPVQAQACMTLCSSESEEMHRYLT
jgi:hypothetical protein